MIAYQSKLVTQVTDISAVDINPMLQDHANL